MELHIFLQVKIFYSKEEIVQLHMMCIKPLLKNYILKFNRSKTVVLRYRAPLLLCLEEVVGRQSYPQF